MRSSSLRSRVAAGRLRVTGSTTASRPLRLRHPLLLLALLFAAGTARGEQTCTDAGCHDALIGKANVHPVAEACDTCHQPTAEGHPRQGKKTFALVQAMPALCNDCHEAFGTAAHVHPPVADGECMTCHDPHSSSEPKLLSAPVGELCGACHGDQSEAAVLHGPVSTGDCTTCHSPHESAQPKLLRAAGDEVCFGCHTDLRAMLAKKNVHPAVESGCTSCHDPHGAANPRLLVETGQALCLQCHAEIGEAVAGAVSQHAPVGSEKACASCHSPHASDEADLLPRPQRETCLSCHPSTLTKAMTVLHGPIRDGSCTGCHQPHGGAAPHLLAAAFPATSYVAYSDEAYALCFQCHDKDLAKYPNTAFATGFRDGERNLHYLHVNAEKGRSCRMCHDVHGSDNASLIAGKVAFGQWQLPLRFVASENGGTCSPGCHRPQTYERKGTPAPRPSPPPAKGH